MVKNERGITLTILIVTIIVILILAGVVMSINMSLNKTTDLKEVVANMELIRTVASDYRNKYVGETVITEENGRKEVTLSDKFIGTNANTSDSNDIIGPLLSSAGRMSLGEGDYYWFKLEQKDLDELKIDIDLKNNELYFVNYYTLDVAYCKTERDSNTGDYKGIKAKKMTKSQEKYYYFYEDLKNLKTDEVRN